jgi:hypothetical protein
MVVVHFVSQSLFTFLNLCDILAKAVCCSKEIKDLKMKIKGNET